VDRAGSGRGKQVRETIAALRKEVVRKDLGLTADAVVVKLEHLEIQNLDVYLEVEGRKF